MRGRSSRGDDLLVGSLSRAGDVDLSVLDLATNWNSDAGSATFWVRMDEHGVDGTQTGLFGRQTGGGGQFGTAMTSWRSGHGN